MSPAKLPSELLEPIPRRIRDLQPGETGLAKFTALRVAANGDCFLRLAEQLLESDTMMTMKVRRDENGLYHVTVQRGTTYAPGSLPPDEKDVPVASVSVERRWLDRH
jgi:hypothetical protein